MNRDISETRFTYTMILTKRGIAEAKEYMIIDFG
jgi:hypothetical protein